MSGKARQGKARPGLLALLILGGLLSLQSAPVDAQQQGEDGELFVRSLKVSGAPEYAIWLNEVAIPHATDPAGWMWDGAPYGCSVGGGPNPHRDPTAVLMGSTLHVTMVLYSCTIITKTILTIEASDEFDRVIPVYVGSGEDPEEASWLLKFGGANPTIHLIEFEVGPLPDDIGYELNMVMTKTDTESHWEFGNNDVAVGIAPVRIYRLLEAPQWIESGEAWGALPWQTLLDYACRHAIMSNTNDSVAAGLTLWVEMFLFNYPLPPFPQQRADGDAYFYSNYWADPPEFNAQLYVAESAHMNVRVNGQCNDVNDLLVLLCRAVGVTSRDSKTIVPTAVSPDCDPSQPFKQFCTWPIDVTGLRYGCQTWSWNYHAIMASPGGSTAEYAWDACSRVNCPPGSNVLKVAWNLYRAALVQGYPASDLEVLRGYVPKVVD